MDSFNDSKSDDQRKELAQPEAIAGARSVASDSLIRNDPLLTGDPSLRDLKRKTASGALVSIASQGANFVLRTGSMIVLARILLPKEFGLVGMVTAFTGFLGLFRDAGLGLAAVQRASISHEQASTLFWVNLAVGFVLSVLCVGAAPILVIFYGEPRLFWATIVLGTSFLFNGVAAQHRAMLQRSMLFGRMATVDLVSLLVSVIASVAGAVLGLGYWSLVIMAVGFPAAAAVGAWLANRWVPGLPHRGTGMRAMLLFGGKVTLNNVIFYFAYNTDKVLIGRLFGAEVLGIYGRAYQLINLPTDNLNSAMSQVAFPALSRIQGDPIRLREYFLKGYSVFLSLVVPITLSCALFAEDIVQVMLGAKWGEVAPIFRLLAPTIFAFAMLNPLGWLMLAAGHADRNLKIAFLIAPLIILGYSVGIPHGPHGVAAGFSITMLLLTIPVVSWAKYGTLITWGDIVKAIGIPFISAIVGTAVVWLLRAPIARLETTLLKLIVESVVLFAVYLIMLLIVFRQWTAYSGFLRKTPFTKNKPSPS